MILKKIFIGLNNQQYDYNKITINSRINVNANQPKLPINTQYTVLEIGG